MTVTVVSKSPAGGRCNLYTRYAQAIAAHFDLKLDLRYTDSASGGGIAPPALLIHENAVIPEDGAIVSPEDIEHCLSALWLTENLAACRTALEDILERFMAEMSRP
ncbi:hypothetical protein [Thioalkalivibrio thiocyanodenitrificans]|uniref:hypothetical protein n=1 Tax=Thioalkalivibrio thiocyanodenitrificans TaxID=243063 RepID=UPI000375A9D9|nr:hypothetical protein [Thioalkalivibrio thiocyanodenitrificans]